MSSPSRIGFAVTACQPSVTGSAIVWPIRIIRGAASNATSPLIWRPFDERAVPAAEIGHRPALAVERDLGVLARESSVEKQPEVGAATHAEPPPLQGAPLERR